MKTVIFLYCINCKVLDKINQFNKYFGKPDYHFSFSRAAATSITRLHRGDVNEAILD